MAIDRTPEEQEEYNKLKKDIIKDIKKEARKKDYNSANKNTSSNSLTDIVKSRREAGEGVFGSLGGAAREKLKEMLDWKRMLPQGGLLTALFPKLLAHKAELLNPISNEGSASSTSAMSPAPSSGDSLATSKPLLDSISVNTKIIAKNSMALPLIQKDTNLMRQTLKKIVKAMQARKKVVPISKVTPVTSKTTDKSVTSGELETVKDSKKEKGPLDILGDLIKSIEKTMVGLVDSLNKTLGNLGTKIVDGIVKGMKGIFHIGKLGTLFLLSLIRPLLAVIFSKVGIGAILAAGIIGSVYAFWKSTTHEDDEESIINMAYATGKLQKIKYDPQKHGSGRIGRINLASENAKQEKEYLENYKKSGGVSPSSIKPEVGVSNSQSVTESIAVGDTIAIELIKSGNIDGKIGKDAAPGKNTSGVIKIIENNLKENPDYYKAKQVLLSTGISYSVDMDTGEIDKNAFSDIENQLNLLIKAGANVTILGTGPHKAYNGIDERLESIGKAYRTDTVNFRPIAGKISKQAASLGLNLPDSGMTDSRILPNADSAAILAKTNETYNPNLPVGASITPSMTDMGGVSEFGGAPTPNLVSSPGGNSSSLVPPANESGNSEDGGGTTPTTSLEPVLPPRTIPLVSPPGIEEELEIYNADLARRGNEPVGESDEYFHSYLKYRIENSYNTYHPQLSEAWAFQIHSLIGRYGK